jgi:hypothetical protein
MVARAAALEKQVDLNPETIRYQPANADRDRALADALALMAARAGIVQLPVPETVAAKRRPKLSESDGEVAAITTLTSEDTVPVPTEFEPMSRPWESDRHCSAFSGCSAPVLFRIQDRLAVNRFILRSVEFSS